MHFRIPFISRSPKKQFRISVLIWPMVLMGLLLFLSHFISAELVILNAVVAFSLLLLPSSYGEGRIKRRRHPRYRGYRQAYSRPAKKFYRFLKKNAGLLAPAIFIAACLSCGYVVLFSPWEPITDYWLRPATLFGAVNIGFLGAIDLQNKEKRLARALYGRHSMA